MKRCKAVTSRACDSIECCLLADHEGAHEGQRDATTRAVWTNPDAPEYLALEGEPPLPGSAEAARLEAIQVRDVPILLVEPVELPNRRTHCACGAMHDVKLDPTLRTEFGMPLAAWDSDRQELDSRFAWPTICRDCGTVYCLIWKT